MKKEELDAIYEKIPDEKKSEAKLMYDELIFMLETSKKLKDKIVKNGPVENFKNGKQKFMRESPALTSYHKTMKTFDIFYKNFTALLPKDEVPLEDSFDEDDL